MATYEIIIRNEGEGEDTTIKQNIAGQSQSKQKASAKESPQLKNALRYVALNTTRELVVSKIGAVTRNNLLQRKIDTAIQLGQTALAFAVNPALGAVTVATSIISQAIDYNLAVEKQANRTRRDWERAGWINRSRD